MEQKLSPLTKTKVHSNSNFTINKNNKVFDIFISNIKKSVTKNDIISHFKNKKLGVLLFVDKRNYIHIDSGYAFARIKCNNNKNATLFKNQLLNENTSYVLNYFDTEEWTIEYKIPRKFRKYSKTFVNLNIGSSDSKVNNNIPTNFIIKMNPEMKKLLLKEDEEDYLWLQNQIWNEIKNMQ